MAKATTGELDGQYADPSAIRKFLLSLRSNASIEYTVPEAMVKASFVFKFNQKLIQAQYSQARADEASLKIELTTQFDLQRALELARALVLISGRTELNEECWKEAITMERIRMARVWNENSDTKCESKGWGQFVRDSVVLR